MRPLSLFGTLAALAMVLLAAWQISQSPDSISGDIPPALGQRGGGEPVSVPIFSGENAQEIGERLEEKGVIFSATQFRLLVALLGYDGLLQAGDYEFERGTPALEAVQRIRSGEVATRTITVIEGWRLEEVAAAVEEAGLGSAADFRAAALAANFSLDFLGGLPPDASVEGYLYPATYRFGRNASVQDIIETMLRRFAEALTPDLQRQAAASGLSLNEAVTLASIIEREARLPEERAIMAQVFLKRLDEGMSLGADPTVQYALGSIQGNVAEFGYWKRELTLRDYDFDSQYNTYAYSGLPPGPICSPRLDSIKAVLQPSSTNYLYFVARPDGSHAFAETYEQHLANVGRYTQ